MVPPATESHSMRVSPPPSVAVAKRHRALHSRRRAPRRQPRVPRAAAGDASVWAKRRRRSPCSHIFWSDLIVAGDEHADLHVLGVHPWSCAGSVVKLLMDGDQPAGISRADLALAVVDEPERLPAAPQRRFRNATRSAFCPRVSTSSGPVSPSSSASFSPGWMSCGHLNSK
jgi:hypothetical protein